MTPVEILEAFDEWLLQASEETLRENCRTEGSVFFAFMKARGVRLDYCAALIQRATGYNPGYLWKNAPPDVVKRALVGYFYSRQYISVVESERNRKVNREQALNLSVPFWKL